MNSAETEAFGASLRASIIRSVTTPLGFFSLVVLVAEAILGGVAIFNDRPEKTYLIIAMIGLIFLLVAIVSLFAAFRPEALFGLRPPRVAPAPDEPPTEPPASVEEIAKEASVSPADVDPKLVRFIPPLPAGKFRTIGLPRPQPPPYFNYPFAPSGKLVLYGIPFFLLPIVDSLGAMRGHLVVDVQPSQANDPSASRMDAQVKEAKVAHFLISAGHGWRMHEGLQFLHKRVGFVRFHFSDAYEQRSDLILGKHLREWAFGNSTALVTELNLSIAKPAWLSHDSSKRFDLLSLELEQGHGDLSSIEVVAQFEDNHEGQEISTPSIIVSAVTIERIQ